VTTLRDLGVRLAVDDYGTGHCSLGYLRRLPVHELKIDCSYVGSMAVHDKDAAIVRSTIQLAHALGMRTVAEGVEDGVTAALLDEAGCDLAQGWHFAAPMSGSDLSAWRAVAGPSGDGHEPLAAIR
jgi:EAL domain-containing protein (putative c-di-GMP-specific phosphodiesterase class I)